MVKKLLPHQLKTSRKTPARKVTFKWQKFKLIHGHMPRGEAIWIMYFGTQSNEPWVPRSPSGQILRVSYTEAKRLATIEAHRRKVYVIDVDAQPL